ncbi:hemolysin XhlA family protein [Clostridium paraputrificum]|jgi:cupin superfamily acireductone dioxygenase involved in methionine salvage|uniref:hemolysin XhlA family protein n=1 Tax=Clostridium paraputrificum TaxID=29363 RepID=UPI000DD0E7BB|nr:hemolysin XhlA family protein [Clostridium paraputrificum]DAU88738.1 MAG TPA: hemolysin [Caudoviricetes sp.]
MDERETIQDIRERLVRIEILLEESSKANLLQINGLDEKIKVCNHRINDLENQNTWLWRAIVGGLITGAIALLFK